MNCECRDAHNCDRLAEVVVLRGDKILFVCSECWFNVDTQVRDLETGETIYNKANKENFK